METYANAAVYRETFETPFLAATKLFYARESAELVAIWTMPEYMRQVRRRRSSRATAAPHRDMG